ncbi:MAG: VOC family protein [Acidimicrobiia bacterium]|nr:VOC family protein [Acidimicrobiia bacterium]MDH4363258.1 VOC family protein [Acidimicrobiia bacterium]MDH5288937.1 VOC family protein [Acidimicrobiia bacterium]
MPELPRFHLAMPVHDLAAARVFYGGLLGCAEGRSADTWVDFNLFGHQFVAHLDRLHPGPSPVGNEVDGHHVPVPHYGVLLSPDAWHLLADRLRAAGITFVVDPHVRFPGEIGEQWTMFVLDPSGNALEFKAFAHDSQVFAH